MIRGCSIVACTLALALTAACGSRRDEPALHELQHAKSGAMDVVLLSASDALRQGKDQAYLEFRASGDQKLVDVGAVKVSATMTMAGMPPMIGNTDVQRTATPGRYAVATDLAMSGSWRLGIEWDGPAGRGSVTLPGRVQ
jgi:hypothetical protein